MEETHPVLATVLFLASLMFGIPNQETAMTGIPPAPVLKISVSPDPLKQGQSGQVCYSFSKDDPSPITLNIAWATLSGAVPDDTVIVTRENPCATVQVPASAVAVTIEDKTGNSADYSGSVQP